MTTERIIAAPVSAEAEAFKKGLVDLLQPRMGSTVTYATDDFFAPKERMIDPAPPVFAEGKYDDHGKWMDGWESRRRRDGGHDYAIVRLGVPGVPRRVDIDTSFFTGNFPPSASIEGCVSDQDAPDDKAAWKPLLAAQPLQGDSHHLFELEEVGQITHVRLQLYPDGGVARLRLYGDIAFDWTAVGDEQVDLAALTQGGRAIAWNDSHYGAPDSILAPGRGVNMGDGWETRRRREPGHDWIIVKLGHVGRIERVIVDTAHFKGNFPESCSMQAALVTDGSEDALIPRSMFWKEMLPRRQLAADAVAEFDDLTDLGPVSHVRFNIHPDGGVSRLRLLGRVA